MKPGNSNTDYYAILGVLPDADQVVIRAAYKALIQRYHPDKFAGDAEAAGRTTQKILEAYAVLSDPGKRAAYDRTRAADAPAAKPRAEAEQERLAESWAVAVSAYPDLEAFAGRLQKISAKLALAYKSHLVAEKAFHDREGIARAFESQFLEFHFGPDPQVVAFARWLAEEGNQAASWTLYQLVKASAAHADGGALIRRVCTEHGIAAPSPEAAVPDDTHLPEPVPDEPRPPATPVAAREWRGFGAGRSRRVGVLLALALATATGGWWIWGGRGNTVPALKAGDVISDCPGCPELVVVPPGQVVMENDQPKYSVSIMYPMAVSRFPVSSDDWAACVAAGGCSPASPGAPARAAEAGGRSGPAEVDGPADAAPRGGRRPVTQVSWDQAQEYVRWLSKRTGYVYRLPSEAELKYATKEVPPYVPSEPMNQWKPNGFGIHGNDFEWVADCAHRSYLGAPVDGRAWMDDPAEQLDADRAVAGLQPVGDPARGRRCTARIVSFAEGSLPLPPQRAGRPSFRVARALVAGPNPTTR